MPSYVNAGITIHIQLMCNYNYVVYLVNNAVAYSDRMHV